MSNSLVSIIVPCYNGERFIDRCFKSILEQTYKNLEIVVVNDGSTDQSSKLLSSYVNIFKVNGMTLKVVEQNNRGLGGAIDTGLKLITGEFLLLLDIDDLLLPNAIESCINAFSDNISLVRGDGFYVNENDINTIIKKFTDEYDGETKSSLFDALVYGNTYNWAGSYMVKTSALFDYYPNKSIYPSRFGQNLQLMLPVAYNHNCSFINVPLMKYVQRNTSLSRAAGNINNYLGYMDIRLTMIDAIVEDEEQRKFYKKHVRIVNNRKLLELYCISGDITKAKERLKMLKSDGEVNTADRKLYYKYKLKSIFFMDKKERKQR